MKFVSILFVMCTLIAGVYADRRAALDIGSSNVKIQVADVEDGKIVRTLYSDWISVPLRAGLLNTGSIEPDLEARLQEVLKSQMEIAQSYGTSSYCGIATAASRQAENGEEVIGRLADALEIPLLIISQEEEGKLGFETACQVSGERDITVWDSGGGSFQLIQRSPSGEYQIYEGPFGRIAALEALANLRGDIDSPLEQPKLPVLYDEAIGIWTALEAELPDHPPHWLGKRVVAIGQAHSVFDVAARHVGHPTFNPCEVRKAIWRLTQAAQAEESRDVPILCLVYSVMDRMGIEEATFCEATGSCAGLLASEGYWNAQTSILAFWCALQ